MGIQPRIELTPEQYLAFEREAETKHEYFGGEIFAMSGASRKHVAIVANALTSLIIQLKGRSCGAFASDLRVKVSPTGLYTYPDIVAICGEPRFDDEHEDTLLNPTVIIEVLSKSTKSYDRGEKFAHYRTLQSLTDYLLIEQNIPNIEHYIRQPSDDWLLSVSMGLDAFATIDSIQCQLALADVYDKVELENETGMPRLVVIKEESGIPYRV